MKRILLLIVLVVFLFSGCNVEIDPNVSDAATQTFITAPVESINSTYAAENTTTLCATKSPTYTIEVVSSTEISTSQPTLAPTETTQKTVIFGFVKHVLNNSIIVNQIDVVCHEAGEKDKFGDEYQNSWLEVVHLDKEYTLQLSDDASHIYADMFDIGTNNDEQIVLHNITNADFLKICTLEYYNNKLYFEFEIVDSDIISSKLLLEYYLIG